MTAVTVARLLRQAGYRLQGNAKTVEGKQHPDRDPVPVHPRAGAGVPGGRPPGHLGGSEKKEPAGNFANGGVEWEPAGDPRKVNVHDFADKQLGKAVPYGVSDVTASTGWVNVGTSAGTGQFAVESIRRWCKTVGEPAYPHARRLLIIADSGGSNGSRPRLWKTGLAASAGQAGLEISVLHLPPGTSKWNRIEHRLFSHISMNWRGRPLESHEVIIETISAVTTSTGLRVQAQLDTGTYPGHQDPGQGNEGVRSLSPASSPIPWRLELHHTSDASRPLQHARTAISSTSPSLSAPWSRAAGNDRPGSHSHPRGHHGPGDGSD